jgi:hypothetical protein
MTNKSEDLYYEVLRHIKAVAELEPGTGFAVENIITDFEQGLQNALQRAFPNSRVRGCYFHFAQAIFRKTLKELLAVAYRTSNVVRKIIKMLIALALLPSDQAFNGFQVKCSFICLIYFVSQKTADEQIKTFFFQSTGYKETIDVNALRRRCRYTREG